MQKGSGKVLDEENHSQEEENSIKLEKKKQKNNKTCQSFSAYESGTASEIQRALNNSK